MYTVYYHEGQKGFFQLKTDYPTQAEAEMFIQSNYFRCGQLKFLFLLKDGKTLVKGTSIENSQQRFDNAMRFALDIPRTQYKF